MARARPRDPTARPALPGPGPRLRAPATCTHAPLPPPLEPAPGPPGQSPRRALGVGARRGRVGPWARRRSVAASFAGRVPGPRGLPWPLLLQERGLGRRHVQGAGGRARGPARRFPPPPGARSGTIPAGMAEPAPVSGGARDPVPRSSSRSCGSGVWCGPGPYSASSSASSGGPSLIRTPGASLSCGRTGRAADVPS